MAGSRLALYLPGLATPPLPCDEAWPDKAQLSSWQRLFSRADQTVANTSLAALFGLAEPIPAGALTSALCGADATAAGYLRADPVHLRADMAKLLLFDAVALDALELGALQDYLAGFFSEFAMQFHATPEGCYLSSAQRIELQARTPASLDGGDISSAMPGGADAAFWHQRLNELQMHLHHWPLNEKRSADGKPVVNSLWFWGAGALPQRPHTPYRQLFSRDADARLLGRWCGCAVYDSLHDSGTPDGDGLLVDQGLQYAAQSGDANRWWTLFNACQAEVITPALTMLAAGDVDELQLYDGERLFRYGRRQQRRWWRRRVDVQEVLCR